MIGAQLYTTVTKLLTRRYRKTCQRLARVMTSAVLEFFRVSQWSASEHDMPTADFMYLRDLLHAAAPNAQASHRNNRARRRGSAGPASAASAPPAPGSDPHPFPDEAVFAALSVYEEAVRSAASIHRDGDPAESTESAMEDMLDTLKRLAARWRRTLISSEVRMGLDVLRQLHESKQLSRADLWHLEARIYLSVSPHSLGLSPGSTAQATLTGQRFTAADALINRLVMFVHHSNPEQDTYRSYAAKSQQVQQHAWTALLQTIGIELSAKFEQDQEALRGMALRMIAHASRYDSGLAPSSSTQR